MPQKLTPELVKTIFAGLREGKPDETFAYVAEDVKWASCGSIHTILEDKAQANRLHSKDGH